MFKKILKVVSSFIDTMNFSIHPMEVIQLETITRLSEIHQVECKVNKHNKQCMKGAGTLL